MQQRTQDLGQVSAVIGAQWGDEGKGKIVDMLAEDFDVVARACGGANAGHTIVVDGTKHVFHLLPSGCLHEDKHFVLGAGLVIHLPTLIEEIETLSKAGIDILPRLHISHAAHILFNFHKEIDGLLEERRSKQKGEGIGTTKRGIGPAYMDKAERRGIRMEHLGSDISNELEERKEELHDAYGISIDTQAEILHLSNAKELLLPCIKDTTDYLHKKYHQGETILVEGAQATLLDIDHGTYPYVTSSSTTAAGALQGLGLAPNQLNTCIGVAKAYCTRVGAGEFATEVEGEEGDELRERGGEYGATTGRPRRCGWLHLEDLRKAATINGLTHWNITKLDVLDHLTDIPVGVGYKSDGSVEYELVPGWQESTAGKQSFTDLPEKAQQYVRYLEEKTKVPVAWIGTGPGREDMIQK